MCNGVATERLGGRLVDRLLAFHSTIGEAGERKNVVVAVRRLFGTPMLITILLPWRLQPENAMEQPRKGTYRK